MGWGDDVPKYKVGDILYAAIALDEYITAVEILEVIPAEYPRHDLRYRVKLVEKGFFGRQIKVEEYLLFNKEEAVARKLMKP